MITPAMIIPALYFPGAVLELVPYRGEAPLFAGRPLGWVLHVQDGLNDPGPYFNRLVRPNRAFSHLWVSKAGLVKQYQTCDRQSWAQEAGNPEYWSVETEGYPNEPLTAAQLAALRRWHVWTGTANRLANAPGQAGIGYHSMGPWGHPLCPGTIRIGQRSQILTPAPKPAPPKPAPKPAPRPVVHSRTLWFHNPLMHGADVVAVQRRVGAVPDGWYGRQTAAAVAAFQRRYWPRWTAQWDGVVGPNTTRALGLVWV
jgi:hypothetical protein